MGDPPVDGEQVLRAQDQAHAEGHDYTKGSPHLRHDSLRREIEARLTRLVRDAVARTGGCRVLEIGAGHGTFTHTLLEAGRDGHRHRGQPGQRRAPRSEEFAGDERVHVVHDEGGEFLLDQAERWDLAVLISVVHHIPDYLAFFRGLQEVVAEGGAIFTVQDPLWYPRRSRAAARGQPGDVLRLAARPGQLPARPRHPAPPGQGRLRARPRSPTSSSTTSCARASTRRRSARCCPSEFDVEVFTYWSTQSPLLAPRAGRGAGCGRTSGSRRPGTGEG